MKRKALFIINPVSGGKRKEGIPELIKTHLDAAAFDADIVFSKAVSHANKMATEAINNYDLVVAVGGDGTVNEVASGLIGSDIVLGIIPCGSGNGLSRFLGIPMDIKKAIETLNTGRVITIDSGNANGQPFFNMAGIGFDAHISEVFAHGKKRGFLTYIKSSFQEFNKYKSQIYHLEIDGVNYEQEAFMLSIANSSQYGNNMHISPQASVQDGLLDVCIIKPFPIYRLPEMGLRMLTKKAEGTSHISIIRGKNIIVKRNSPGPMHFDGEPYTMDAEINIKILPQSLKVIAGDSY